MPRGARKTRAAQVCVDVFALRNDLIDDYARYIQGFIRVRDERIRETIDQEIGEGLLWPEPLAQISPSFEPGGWIEGTLGVTHDSASGRLIRCTPRALTGPSARGSTATRRSGCASCWTSRRARGRTRVTSWTRTMTRR